jgi:hypothetical protein
LTAHQLQPVDGARANARLFHMPQHYFFQSCIDFLYFFLVEVSHASRLPLREKGTALVRVSVMRSSSAIFLAF